MPDFLFENVGGWSNGKMTQRASDRTRRGGVRGTIPEEGSSKYVSTTFHGKMAEGSVEDVWGIRLESRTGRTQKREIVLARAGTTRTERSGGKSERGPLHVRRRPEHRR